MKIQKYESFDSRLIVEWEQLQKNAFFFPFQSLSWLLTWYQEIGKLKKNLKLQIITLKKNNEIIAIFPLLIRSNFKLRILEWIGGVHTDYMGPLLHKDFKITKDEFNNVWNEVLKMLDNFDVIHFKKQYKEINGLQNPFVNFLNCNTWFHQSYIADISEKWDLYTKNHVKNKILNDNQRQIRRLEKIGNVKFLIPNTVNDKDLILKILFKQKREKYSKTKVWDMLAKKENREFYTQIVKKNINSECFEVHLSCLKIKNEIIAAHLGFIKDKTFYYIMPSFDIYKWNKFSPGKILLEYLIKWSIEKNLKYFDFTYGNEPYKLIWSNKKITLYEFIEYNNFFGILYILLQNFILIIKNNNFLKKKIGFLYNQIKNYI